MNCFIQHYDPHSQLITKNCSSVSHFHHCGQILLPAVHFHSIHLLFLHYSAVIRYGTSLLKIPNFNLVKKLADWTISAVPSFCKLTERLHSCSGLLCARGSVRHPSLTGECEDAHARSYQHTCTKCTLARCRGPIMGYCDGERLWEIHCHPPHTPPQAAYSPSDTLPACPLTVIRTLWYLRMENKGTMETLNLLWRMWCWCFPRRHKKIILNSAVVYLPNSLFLPLLRSSFLRLILVLICMENFWTWKTNTRWQKVNFAKTDWRVGESPALTVFMTKWQN